ncbi:unnamed protein product [Toxocara canis]|uniref:SH3 domain-containing protein n=1 Tax=Toxocara canis TaxID=6265 RepID=A0A183U3S8_TOXCA|nr:unnamed protein product [Toxocara canis]
MSRSDGKSGLIAGIVTALLVLIAAVFVGLFVMFQLKRKQLKQQQQQQLPSTNIDTVTGGALSSQALPPSESPESEWAPDKIKASQFNYKGPLQIPFKQPLILVS